MAKLGGIQATAEAGAVRPNAAPPETEALLLLMGFVARLECGLAAQDGQTSALAERLNVLAAEIKGKYGRD